MANMRFPKVSKKLTKLLKDKDLAEVTKGTGLSEKVLREAQEGIEIPSIEQLTTLARYLGTNYRDLVTAALDDLARVGEDKPQAAPKKERNASPLMPVNRW